METEKKLKIIGFTNFVHLNKSKRDKLKRLFFTSKYKDNWFTIQLVMKNNIWEVEKMTGEKDFLSFFKNENPDISEVISVMYQIWSWTNNK